MISRPPNNLLNEIRCSCRSILYRLTERSARRTTARNIECEGEGITTITIPSAIDFNITHSRAISQRHNLASGGSSADQGKQLSYNVLDTAGLFVERQRGRGDGERGGGSNGDGGGGTATASAATASNGGCGVGGAATESAATAAPAAFFFAVQQLCFATLCKIAFSCF